MAVTKIKSSPKHKRPSKADSKAAFDLMTTTATKLIMQHRGRQYKGDGVEYILMDFPVLSKFSKCFPKGKIVSRTPDTVTRRINAMKLLDWLFIAGYAPYNSAMFIKQTKQFEYFVKDIDRKLGLEKG